MDIFSRKLCFNSIKVRLIQTLCNNMKPCMEFQFHKGAINTHQQIRDISIYTLVFHLQRYKKNTIYMSIYKKNNLLYLRQHLFTIFKMSSEKLKDL